jgi:DNA-directed RNA polymerase
MDYNQIEQQLEREELQRAWGQELFKAKLQKQKSGRDYSRSPGGKLIQRSFLDDIIEKTRERLQPYLDPEYVGKNADVLHPVLKAMTGLPLYDRIVSEKDGTVTMVKKVDDDGNEVLVDALNYEQAALIALQTTLDTVQMGVYTMEEWKRGKRDGARPTSQQLCKLIGKRIETEFIIQYAKKQFPDHEFHKGFVTRCLANIYNHHAGADQKDYVTRRKFQKIADDGFFSEVFGFKPWSNSDHQVLGSVMLAILQSAANISNDGEDAPLFIEEPGPGGFNFIHLSETGTALVEKMELTAGNLAYVDLPMLCLPKPHLKGVSGGYLNTSGALGRPTVKETWKAELQLSDLHRSFQNQQQSVALRVCKPILDIMEELVILPPGGRDVGSFVVVPTIEEYVTIEFPENIRYKLDNGGKASMNEAELELFEEVKRQRADQMKAYHPAKRKASQAMTAQVLKAARQCRDDERFYVVVTDCFRGRFYCSSGPINYQGQDHQKGLIEFADAVEVDDRTEYWMKLGMAGFMGLDKLSYADRIAGFDAVQHHIIDAVRNPIQTDWWKDKNNVEKPWQWMQVAIEWVRLFVDNDSDRTTRCRVPVDATCSGQQIIAGWTRSRKTAEQVNLTNSDAPMDIYGNVLAAAVRSLKADDFVVTCKAKHRDAQRQPILKRRLNALGVEKSKDSKRWGAVRKGSKAILMVAQYGAGVETRVQDFIDNLKLSWLKDDEQTFTFSEGRAIYAHFEEGLNECVPALDGMITWVQSVVDAALTRPLAKNYILIPLSDGSIVKQLYPERDKSGRIELTHLNSFIRKDTKRKQVHNQVSTDKAELKKHKSSTTANLVHGGDSCALVFAGRHFGDIPFTTNHDSVSGRPGREMDVIVESLKKGLLEVFKKNPLRQFVELNGLRWDDYPAPTFADFDGDSEYELEDVLRAAYPYS